MKYTNVEEFVKNFVDNGHEESLWEMVDDYRRWKNSGDIGDCLLRANAQTFCSYLKIPIWYHVDFMEKIVMGIYEHFALKYREMKND
jgi:hypothetical protein